MGENDGDNLAIILSVIEGNNILNCEWVVGGFLYGELKWCVRIPFI